MNPPGILSAPLALLALVLFVSAATAPRAQDRTLSVASNNVALSELEREIVEELNLVRTHPAEYASHLESWKPYFKGKELRAPGRTPIVTEEGAAALDEAVSFLRSAKPLAPFSVSGGMCSGARELVRDQEASGVTGHRGADGSYCEQRIARFGSFLDPVGENLSYGNDTARERVIALLIDDGVANRGHRQRLMSPEYKVAGVACGRHQMGTLCVITLAAGFTDKIDAGGPKGIRKF